MDVGLSVEVWRRLDAWEDNALDVRLGAIGWGAGREEKTGDVGSWELERLVADS